MINSSVQLGGSVVSDSTQPHGLQHTKLPCLSPIPRACSNSCPFELVMPSNSLILCRPLSSHLQTFSASVSFPISQFFTSGSQSIGVLASASVLPMNVQDCPRDSQESSPTPQFKSINSLAHIHT